MPSARRGVRRLGRAVMPQHAFHLILELELAFLQGDFFELFGFREVLSGGETMNPFIQVVMLSGESAELVVALQQLLLHFLEICRHFRLLESGPYARAFIGATYHSSRHRIKASSDGFV